MQILICILFDSKHISKCLDADIKLVGLHGSPV